MIQAEQLSWGATSGWQFHTADRLKNIPQLVLAFGNYDIISNPIRFEELRDRYPLSHILCSTTAGEIPGNKVTGNSLAVTAISFEKTIVKVAQTSVVNRLSSFDSGLFLAEILQADDLVHIFVICDGHLVNASELVQGLNLNNKLHVPITGGLASGAGVYLQKMLVGINEPPIEGRVVAVGFYGQHLKIGTDPDHGLEPSAYKKVQLAMVVSCLGRKLVLRNRAEEGAEEALKILGNETVITGFYTHGEISPLGCSTTCEFHTQTMSITTYIED